MKTPDPSPTSTPLVLDGETLFDRKQAGHFPEPKHIKQLVRDRVAPGRSLGHVDR